MQDLGRQTCVLNGCTPYFAWGSYKNGTCEFQHWFGLVVEIIRMNHTRCDAEVGSTSMFSACHRHHRILVGSTF